jgi:hypothetical protein
MDWSVLLGALGICVSIGVGWVTYRLASRRATSERYILAKDTVLRELSKSLGEDAVPSLDILEATIRSVLHDVGDPQLQLNVADIFDDLLRQVTSDPFLDAARRRKLQSDIQASRAQATRGPNGVTRVVKVQSSSDAFSNVVPSTAVALVAALVSLVGFAIPIARASRGTVFTFLQQNRDWLVSGVAVVFAGLVISLTLDPILRKVFRKLLGPRDRGDEKKDV